MMKARYTTILAAIALGVSTLAAAQQGPAAEGRHAFAAAREAAGAKLADARAAHVAKLHDALKLTAAQEPAWTAFQAAMTPAVGAERPTPGAAGSLSAPERAEKTLAMAKVRIAHMESHLAALKAFYAVLSPDQQKVFDLASHHDGRPGMIRKPG